MVCTEKPKEGAVELWRERRFQENGEMLLEEVMLELNLARDLTWMIKSCWHIFRIHLLDLDLGIFKNIVIVSTTFFCKQSFLRKNNLLWQSKLRNQAQHVNTGYARPNIQLN